MSGPLESLGLDTSISLVREDGLLLAHFPPNNEIGNPSSGFGQRALAAGGTIREIGRKDRTMRLRAARMLPGYPALARQARIQGTVHLAGIVGRDGSIQQLRVVSGHPLLVGAALAAVRQWLYQPTLLNGEPVEVFAPIDVTFTLAP